MLAKFDPAGQRNYWLQSFLGYVRSSDPERIVPPVRPHYAQAKTSSMIEAYLLGLAEEVRPTLEKLLAWMETQPEPDRLVFSEKGHSEDAWGLAVYEWRQALGLCRWLMRADPVHRELRSALEADLRQDLGRYFTLKMNGYAFEFDSRGRIVQSKVYDRTGFRGDASNPLRAYLSQLQSFADTTNFREFYKERDVVREERRMRIESSPQGQLIEALSSTAFAAHPYQNTAAGWASDIESLRATDAEAFYKRYYAPSNLTIGIAGDVNPAQAKKLAERYFGRIPARPTPPLVNTVEPPQTGEKRVMVASPAQPFLVIAFKRPHVGS